MDKEKLRQKKLKKQKKRKEILKGKEEFVNNQKKYLKERMQIFEAGKEVRYWKTHFHFHKWSKLGVKKPEGGFRVVGKICNMCGKKKMNTDWIKIAKKIVGFLFFRK
jgi:hypothetical protein